MAAKTFSTYLSELAEVTALGAGDRIPVLESSATKYVDGGDVGGTAYLKYVALLSQTGTDAPVATVLENTLGGTVVWARVDVGVYQGTLAGAFTENKTTALNNAAGGGLIFLYRSDSDTIQIDATDIAGNFDDGILSGNTIEIRVYP